MIAVNPAQTHVIVSFVATGHVLFIEAASRSRSSAFERRLASAVFARLTWPRPLPTAPT